MSNFIFLVSLAFCCVEPARETGAIFRHRVSALEAGRPTPNPSMSEEELAPAGVHRGTYSRPWRGIARFHGATALSLHRSMTSTPDDGSPPDDELQENPGRQPERNRHPGVSRGQRAGDKTVAVYAEEDKLALHRFKADEAYRIGEGKGRSRPISRSTKSSASRTMSGADAIHPGYGFLSESPEFADACAEAGIIFIGPTAETMRSSATRSRRAIWRSRPACR